MKINQLAFLFFATTLAWISVPAAVTFTNTPTAVSNTYSGTLTLQIAGLTNRTVVVQKYLDLNTNGIIDSGDWLVQQFTLQDGTNFVVGGVTNFNVPGDLNSTAGAITATLNFQNGDFVQNITGNYLYRLSSPKGYFAPITNQFAVTNFPFSQKFTGNVVSNSTSTVVSNAVVLLFPASRAGKDGPSGSPVAGAVANNAGGYTLPAPPGTYMLVTCRSNYVADMAAAPVLTLAASQNLTTNLSLLKATSTISGQLADATAGTGLGGVLLPVQSDAGRLAIAFTDTNGNFNVPVTAGNWNVKADDMALIIHGCLGLQNKTHVAAGTTGVLLTVPEATALIYGRVRTDSGNPLVGLDVYANDDNGLYETDAYTDASGNYVIGVLGLGSDDAWSVQANNDYQLTNYVFSLPGGNANLDVGQAQLLNFTALLATNVISGSVKDGSGNAITGVGVYTSADFNGTNYQTEADTDDNGHYSMNIPNGSWYVGINRNGGDDSLDNQLGSGDYLAPANQLVTISQNNATENLVVYAVSNHITGNVQANGTNIVNVEVQAGTTILGVTYNQEAGTDSSGNYSLGVVNADWTLGVNCSGNTDNNWNNLDGILGSGNYQCPASRDVVINNNSGSASFMIATGGGTGQISGYVTDSEGGSITGVTVYVNDGGANNYSMPTDASGYYSFAVGSGGWNVGVDCSGLNALGFQCASNQSVTLNNINLAVNFIVAPLYQQSLILVSDASTLASSLDDLTALDAGDTSGLTFQPVLVGAYGTYTPVPSRAPAGAEVIQIPPANGENGFFKTTFVLPKNFSAIHLHGGANVDDYGRAFLNGHPLSPSLTGSDSAVLSENGDATFDATNAAWFVSGTNELLFADWNSGGGPSGAAFYAAIAFTVHPILAAPVKLSNGQFQFQLSGVASQNYTIQMSTNLVFTNWTTLLITNCATTNSFNVMVPSAAGRQCFYRVQTGP
jgi:hypothetical protein